MGGEPDVHKVDDRDPGRLRYWFTAGWVIWLALFAVLEGIAIKDRRKGDTLSEHVWWAQERLRNAGMIGKVLYGALAGGIFILLTWLIFHFILGWW